MKLKHKISLYITLFAIVILTSILSIYTIFNYKDIIKDEQQLLLTNAINSAYHVESELTSMLNVIKTIASAPLVAKKLKESNLYYSSLSDKQRKNEINRLNHKWMMSENNDDSFVLSYMNNKLASYLKSQQKILPKIYGEIFISNIYGMTVATTNKLTTLKHAYKYWWQKSYDNGKGKVFFDDSGYDDSVQDYVIGITVPIKKSGKLIGIIKANILIMGALNNILTRYNKLKKGTFTIVRTKGSIVLEQGFPPLSTNLNPKLLDGLQNECSGTKIIKDYNQEKIFAYAPIRLTLDNKDILFGGKTQKLISTKSNQGEIWHTVVSYDKQKALSSLYKNNFIIIFIGLISIVFSTIIAYIIGKLVARPIDRLSNIAKRIGEGEHNLKANINSKDEVGMLAKSFNEMLDKLKATTASRNELILEVKRRKEAEIKLKNQEELMMSQSRHAAMNDMISMLAHQWRQPIAAISMGANNILIDIELENLDAEVLKKTSNDILTQTKELSQTINNFKNFFKPEKELEEISVEDIFKETFKIIGKSLDNNGIKVTQNFNTPYKMYTYSNELIQIFLNIITNAQEALLKNKAESKEINIEVNEEGNKTVVITICNNGESIDKDTIDKIFEPYFTTKEKMVGTGIGLYMSKTIVEKHLNGTIKVENIRDGVCFKIRVPLRLKEIK